MSETSGCDIPVHCVIEELAEGCCLKCTSNGERKSETRKLHDSYAIVAGRTPLSKLNDAVLTALGFPQFASAAATAPSATLPLQAEGNKTRGMIVIDNWKPLNFEQITDDLETPIEHLFKHIGGNRWTLKILVSSEAARSTASANASTGSVSESNGLSEGEVKTSTSNQDTVSLINHTSLDWIRLLPRYHPYLSTYAGYPKMETLTASNIASIMATQLLSSVTEAATVRPSSEHVSPLFTWPASDTDHKIRENSNESKTGKIGENCDQTFKYEVAQRSSVLVAPTSLQTNIHPMSKHAPPATCRLMFDPLTELPMLNEWFENNSHPTCHDIEKYTEALNSRPYRRTYPPVSIHNVKIWFKNKRAKCKRL